MEKRVEISHDYEIEIQGQLGRNCFRSFHSLTARTLADGRTILYARELDQSALFGVLLRIRDLGTPLLSVWRCESPPNDEQS